MAEVVPFPLHRRRKLVLRLARRFVSAPERAAEEELRDVLLAQARLMAHRGIQPGLIAETVRALDIAVRAAACRIIFYGGVAS